MHSPLQPHLLVIFIPIPPPAPTPTPPLLLLPLLSCAPAPLPHSLHLKSGVTIANYKINDAGLPSLQPPLKP